MRAGGGEQILTAAELELCALRLQRRPLNGTRTLVFRLFGLLLLLGLLAAGLGAMWYLQTIPLPPKPPPHPGAGTTAAP